MNKLEDLIKFAEKSKVAYRGGSRYFEQSTDETKQNTYPFFLRRAKTFEDIAKALTLLKEIINHLDVDVDYTDTDFNDIIHGYYFKLEFDNDDDKDFQIADELYEWYENETYNDEYWREEYERNER